MITSVPWLPDTFLDKLQSELGLSVRHFDLPSVSFHPMDDRPVTESMFFGSEHARAYTVLTDSDMAWFVEQAPVGYATFGFWGYGVNSYAFYYSRVDEWSRVFFRLPYGGVYMDNIQAADYISAFVPAYFEFERRIRGVTDNWIALDAMGSGRYLRQAGIRQWEYRESIVQAPDPIICLEENLL